MRCENFSYFSLVKFDHFTFTVLGHFEKMCRILGVRVNEKYL